MSKGGDGASKQRCRHRERHMTNSQLPSAQSLFIGIDVLAILHQTLSDDPFQHFHLMRYVIGEARAGDDGTVPLLRLA